MHVLEDTTLAGARRPRDPRRRSRHHAAWCPRDARPASGTTVRIDERRSPRLEFVVIGLDHATAGIELRERLAFTDAEIPAALKQLTDPAERLLGQAAILSTCNRVEVYGVARSRPSHDELAAFLARFHEVDPGELVGAIYVHRGDDVAHHLAATAAGLHSLVLGEAQIQGQVRSALEYALAAGTAGPELRRMFESAIAAGRRVRSHTAIGRGVASAPHLSVEFARGRLGTLGRSTALLIGAGSTAELAAKQLVKRGVGQLLILGRDPARAERLAQRYGGRVIGGDRLIEALAQCDLVISSTSAPHPILSLAQLEQALARGGRTDSRPLLLLDLAVPRDVEPAVATLPGVEVHTIDDLRGAVERTLAQRRAELPAAYSVLRAEVARFGQWLSRREAVTT